MQHLSSKLQPHDLAKFKIIASERKTQGKSCIQLDNRCYTEQIDNCLSEFKCFTQDNHYIDAHAAEIVSLRSKIATLTLTLQLNSSGAEDEILTPEADIQLMCSAQEQFWNLLTEEKGPQHEEMCSLLDCIIQLHLFMSHPFPR